MSTGSTSPFRHLSSPAYVLYVAVRALSTLALSMLNLIVAWVLYDETGNPLYLGLAGLMIFLPSLLLVLVAGMAADRFRRQHILALCFIVLTLCAATLAALAMAGQLHPIPVLAVLAVVGSCRAFFNPTIKALLVNLVEREQLPAAIALNASLSKIAVVSGPVLGGLLYAFSAVTAFALSATLFLFAALVALTLRSTTQIISTARLKLGDLWGGLSLIRHDGILLGALSLDLFVMFISGATALLPVFAKDVLGTDAFGLGLLRSASAVGAVVVAGLLAWKPITRQAGRIMLACVAAYGVCILAFGFSTSFWLSYLALVLAGGSDAVSVNVRESLVQLRTPDDMRGRVTAVNSVFIGASNELGDFRAGGMAAAIGAVPSVIFGGAAALVIASAWYRVFPGLRNLERLE